MAEKKPIKITETILRDAHQSLIATRMTTEQMMPIVDKLDKVGNSVMVSRTRSFRCSSGDRISLDIVRMATMW